MIGRLLTAVFAAAIFVGVSGTAQSAPQIIVTPNPVVVGNDITVAIRSAFTDLIAFDLTVTFDDTLLSFDSAAAGADVDPSGSLFATPSGNLVQLSYAGIDPTSSSDGELATLLFHTLGSGSPHVSFVGSYFNNDAGAEDTLGDARASITIEAASVAVAEPGSASAVAGALALALLAMARSRRRRGDLAGS